MPRPTETARERELFRYFTPPEHSEFENAVPQSSSDLSLTAFAQLGALRLNAKRAFISLVGRTTEYIIAEAGQSLSLQDENRHDEHDQLWHGVGALKTKAGIGTAIIDLLSGITQPAEPQLIVNDLTLDDRFRHLSIVTEGPRARFLACFPLRTSGGYVIGIYTIVDDKPRDYVSDLEMQFLSDMAVTAMNHIEVNRTKLRHHRAEKMVKALGLYVEGGESLREWWITQGQEGRSIRQGQINADIRRGKTVGHQANVEFGIQDSPDTTNSMRFLHLRESTSEPEENSCRSATGDGRPRPPSLHTNSSTTVQSELFGNLASSEPGDAARPTISTTADDSSLGAGKTFLDTPEAGPDLPRKGLQDEMLTADVKRSFSRASNLLREAMGVCGVMFFDASIGSFGKASQRANMNEKAPGAHVVNGNVETTTSSSETDFRNALSDDDQQKGEVAGIYASILAFSTRSRSSLMSHISSTEQQSFPESILRRLAKRYPHGKIFNFEEDGSISSSDSEPRNDAGDGDAKTLLPKDFKVEDSRKKKTRSREAEAKAIIAAVPGARSVAWFPLWDPSLERWFAGTLIYSTTPHRVLSPDEDLTYMATFGNSIMAEVSRMSALAASQLKVDFISSISHELRSPLHGILASVEFLEEEGVMSDAQADMVNTIHSCGKTLLELIDHVLDFAKINKKLKKKPKGSRRSQAKLKDGRDNKASEITEETASLCVLSEEVIESVYAGQFMAHQFARSRRMSDTSQLESISSQPRPPPIVTIDFSYCDNWEFQVDIGAWKRVLMNLFSNALKYTESGFIQVMMHIQNDEVSRDGTTHPRVCLAVKDSGKGISQEFLKNHIYTAFKQEDALAVGAGLGLSFVRQICIDLGGKIELRSDLGVGTQAYVSLPLKRLTNPPLVKTKDPATKVRTRTQGLKACIVNKAFDVHPDISDAPTGILSRESEALIILKSSVRVMMTDWFCMDVRTSADLDLDCADLHITVASKDLETDLQISNKLRARSPQTVTVIVLCSILTRSTNYSMEDGLQVFYLQQPVSPQKFASVLYDALYRRRDIPYMFAMPSLGPAPTTSLALRSPRTLHHTLKRSPPSSQHWSSTSSLDCKVFGDTFRETAINYSPTSSRNFERKRPPGISRHHSDNSVLYDTLSSGDSESVDLDNKFDSRHILLVEDNEINLKLLVLCMTKLGHTFVAAKNGLEALEAYKAAYGSFDIIFIDVQMPVMDGLKATREMRRYEIDKRLKPTAVVALTGGASANSRQEAYSSGVDRYLTKPVSMKTLRGILSDLKAKGRDGIRDMA